MRNDSRKKVPAKPNQRDKATHPWRKGASMKTESLYLDSAFGDWLRQCPTNVEHNYDEFNVDLHGTRVSVCFSVPDELEQN